MARRGGQGGEADPPAAGDGQARRQTDVARRQRSVRAIRYLAVPHAVDLVAGVALTGVFVRPANVSGLFLDMLGEYPDHRAFDGRAGVEQIGCDALDGIPQSQKLRLPRNARRTPDAGELVHRRVADLAVDGVVAVLHRKSERQAFGVISDNFATRQRHRMLPLAPPRRVLRHGSIVETELWRSTSQKAVVLRKRVSGTPRPLDPAPTAPQ